MNSPFKGIIVPIVTPFDEQGRFNPAALSELIEFLVGHGVHGIFPIGSVGEFYALETAEIQQIIKAVVEAVRGRVPVIAGTGAIDTRRSIALSQYAEAVGADGLTILTPYYIQPSSDEIYEHYAAILRSVKLPVLGYSNPGRSGGVALTPDLVRRLATAFEHFAGMKDSSGDLPLLKTILRATPPGFAAFTGADPIIFEALINGAAGAVAGIANFAPRLVVAIYERTLAGDYAAARALQDQVARLRLTYSLGTFPAVTKAATRLRGLSVGPTRSPVGPLSTDTEQQLRASLVEVLGAEALDHPEYPA